MADFVVTGLIMGAAFAAYRLYDKVKQKQAEVEEIIRGAEARRTSPPEPRDLGQLARDEAGVYVPAPPNAKEHPH